jgi:hypothetical protein
LIRLTSNDGWQIAAGNRHTETGGLGEEPSTERLAPYTEAGSWQQRYGDKGVGGLGDQRIGETENRRIGETGGRLATGQLGQDTM